MKTTFLVGLTALFTSISIQAAIIGTVDTVTKTITFEGSLERSTRAIFYMWNFGTGEVLSYLSEQESLNIAGTDPGDFSLLEGNSSGLFWGMGIWDADGGVSDLNTPIVADPTSPYSYSWGSLSAIAAFESALASSDIVAANDFNLNARFGQTGPITLTLKGGPASAVPEPGYGMALLGLLGCSAMWRRKRS